MMAADLRLPTAWGSKAKIFEIDEKLTFSRWEISELERGLPWFDSGERGRKFC